MFNSTRLFGALGIAALIATATATTANAADQFPVPGTTVTLSAAQVGDCNTDGTRTITYEGTASPTPEGSTLVGIFLGDVELGTSGVLETFRGTQTFTVTGSKLPGTYNASLFYSQRDTTEMIDLDTVTVPECITPVTPTLDVITTGECTLSVLYTGDRPELTLSLAKKRVLVSVLEEDVAQGRINVTIDANGAPVKGKNAFIYRVTVKADNGLTDSTNVRCA